MEIPCMWTTLSLRTENGMRDRSCRQRQQEWQEPEVRRQGQEQPKERAGHRVQECPNQQAAQRQRGQGRQPEKE